MRNSAHRDPSIALSFGTSSGTFPLRVSLHPHATDEVYQISDPRYPILDRIDQLIFVTERAPYLDAKSASI